LRGFLLLERHRFVPWPSGIPHTPSPTAVNARPFSLGVVPLRGNTRHPCLRRSVAHSIHTLHHTHTTGHSCYSAFHRLTTMRYERTAATAQHMPNMGVVYYLTRHFASLLSCCSGGRGAADAGPPAFLAGEQTFRFWAAALKTRAHHLRATFFTGVLYLRRTRGRILRAGTDSRQKSTV